MDTGERAQIPLPDPYPYNTETVVSPKNVQPLYFKARSFVIISVESLTPFELKMHDRSFGVGCIP